MARLELGGRRHRLVARREDGQHLQGLSYSSLAMVWAAVAPDHPPAVGIRTKDQAPEVPGSEPGILDVVGSQHLRSVRWGRPPRCCPAGHIARGRSDSTSRRDKGLRDQPSPGQCRRRCRVPSLAGWTWARPRQQPPRLPVTQRRRMEAPGNGSRGCLRRPPPRRRIRGRASALGQTPLVARGPPAPCRGHRAPQADANRQPVAPPGSTVCTAVAPTRVIR